MKKISFLRMFAYGNIFVCALMPLLFILSLVAGFPAHYQWDNAQLTLWVCLTLVMPSLSLYFTLKYMA